MLYYFFFSTWAGFFFTFFFFFFFFFLMILVSKRLFLHRQCKVFIFCGNGYLLGMDYYQDESIRWMMIKDRGKTNICCYAWYIPLLTKSPGFSRGRNPCGFRGYFPFVRILQVVGGFFTIKGKSDKGHQYKAHFVAKGNLQIYGKDYRKILALTTNMASIRLLLQIAV